jgi:GPI-anchor transamidase subunit GAA1
MKIGAYLPAVVLVSTAMLFSGLGEWVQARWVEIPTEKESTISLRWSSRKRPVLPALLIVVFTHLDGVLLFCAITNSWINSHKPVCLSLFLLSALLTRD